MKHVVLDTDIASLSLKGHLPPSWARALIGRITAVTFVTVEYEGLRIVVAERSER